VDFSSLRRSTKKSLGFLIVISSPSKVISEVLRFILTVGSVMASIKACLLRVEGDLEDFDWGASADFFSGCGARAGEEACGDLAGAGVFCSIGSEILVFFSVWAREIIATSRGS